MSLKLEQADSLREDFALQLLWYAREAGAKTARRFYEAVDSTLLRLCERPELGRERHFKHPRLQGIRSFRVAGSFHCVLIFYRVKGDALQAVRLMHGARDLRRLAEPSGSSV